MCWVIIHWWTNFNPRSPRGERRDTRSLDNTYNRFQSTLPARGATYIWFFALEKLQFQSTLPARGATKKGKRTLYIIHISIHAPREGSDSALVNHASGANTFQSTLPARGATGTETERGDNGFDFNPRSPRGERRNLSAVALRRSCISIHAPREGSDVNVFCLRLSGGISIHAPREGSDSSFFGALMATTDFNPRSPRGERPLAVEDPEHGKNDFNPRSPRGERRHWILPGYCIAQISIHAPREGSDSYQID